MQALRFDNLSALNILKKLGGDGVISLRALADLPSVRSHIPFYKFDLQI